MRKLSSYTAEDAEYEDTGWLIAMTNSEVVTESLLQEPGVIDLSRDDFAVLVSNLMLIAVRELNARIPARRSR